VLEVIEQEGLCARAVAIGETMVGTLRELAREIPAIGEVRNLGAMVAMELVKDRDPHAPDADLTKALTKRAAEKGLVLLSCGLYGNVIRFLVPLTVSDAVLREGLGIVTESLRELTGGAAKAVVNA
jgi:4-aminobutyrate aminotransferase/(S)-3-amino-2-methylpropionate transaminase